MKYGTLIAILSLPSIALAQPAADSGAADAGGDAAEPADARDVRGDERAAVGCVDRSTAGVRDPVHARRDAAAIHHIALRTQERNPIRLDVGYLPRGDVMMTAKPLSQGLYAGGIVMTTFAGMGIATGVTLTAVGCSAGTF
jgi:hypothetical protein